MGDSLESIFVKDHVDASQIICRAFNNRKNMFFLNTSGSLGEYAKFLSENQLKLDKQRQLEEDEQREFIDSLDDDEYAALDKDVREKYEQQMLQKSKERLAAKRAKLAAEEAERRRLEEEEEERKRAEEEANKKGKKKGGASGADKKPVSPAKPRGSNVDVLENNEATENERSGTAEKKRGGAEVTTEVVSEEALKRSNSEIMAMVSEAIVEKFRKYEKTNKDVQHVVNYW